MPRTTNGTYQQPTGTSAIYNTVIDPTEYNSLISDLGQEITNSLDRYGRAAMLAALQMGGFRITNMANGVAATDAATVGQLPIPTGTAMLFAQAAAPTGWTQVTTVNDAALRIVSGSGGVSHGTVGLSAFISGGTGSHVLSWNEMPVHSHGVNDPPHAHGYTLVGTGATGFQGGIQAGNVGGTTAGSQTGVTIQNSGASWGHNHPQQDLSYYDCIICTKN